MEKVNERNNQPHLFASDEETVRAVYNKCRELTWPHLKNSTRKQYEEHFTTHLLPEFGNSKVRKLTTMELQAYFNTLSPEALAEVDPVDSRHSARGSEPGHRVGHARPESSSWREAAEETCGEANRAASSLGTFAGCSRR